MRRATIGLLCAAMILAGGTTAWADAIGPPPDDCFEGTRGESCHGGDYCRLDGCATNDDCDPGEICEPRSFCFGTIDCTGGWNPEAGPFLETTVADVCPNTSGCACSTENVCVPEEGPPTPGGIGCACNCAVVGADHPASPAALFAIGVVLLLSGFGVLRRRVAPSFPRRATTQGRP